MRPELLSLVALLPTIGLCDGPKPMILSERMRADITTENLIKYLRAPDQIATVHRGNQTFGLPGYQALVNYIWDRVSRLRAHSRVRPNLFAVNKEGLIAEIVPRVDGDAGCRDKSCGD